MLLSIGGVEGLRLGKGEGKGAGSLPIPGTPKQSPAASAAAWSVCPGCFS